MKAWRQSSAPSSSSSGLPSPSSSSAAPLSASLAPPSSVACSESRRKRMRQQSGSHQRKQCFYFAPVVNNYKLCCPHLAILWTTVTITITLQPVAKGARKDHLNPSKHTNQQSASLTHNQSVYSLCIWWESPTTGLFFVFSSSIVHTNMFLLWTLHFLTIINTSKKVN